MLIPSESTVGSGYNVGLTATALCQQPDAWAGGGYTSPSGRPVSGLKIGFDEAWDRTAADQRSRYLAGPPALGALSESGHFPKDTSAAYVTEAEAAARGFYADVRRGWDNRECRALALAALVAGWFILGR